MHSRTSLIVILTVAFTFSSNVSAQSQSSASSFSTSAASAQSGPLMIELDAPGDERRPTYVKEGNRHQDAPSTTIPRDRGYIDQEYPIAGTTITSEPRPEPKQDGHHENTHSASPTAPKEDQHFNAEENADVRFAGQTGSEEFKDNANPSDGDEVRFELVTGTDNSTSFPVQDSSEMSHQTHADDPDNSSNDWGVEEDRPRYGPHGRHPDNPHQNGRSKPSTENGGYTGSSEGDNAGHHSSGVNYGQISYESGNPGQTLERPSADEAQDQNEANGEFYPTRTAHTPYYSAGGSGHRYPGVPVGEQVYCQGPLDPETGEGVIDINGRCSIVCYNNLVLNRSGDNCVCPPTLHLDHVHARCVCRSPYVLSSGKCVLPPSQRAQHHASGHRKRSMIPQTPIGQEMIHGKYVRTEKDKINCPASEIACPLPSGGYECLDPEFTLDSCGGCSSDGTGTDCWKIEGANGVGCNAGSCLVFSCLPGLNLVDNACTRPQ